LLPVRAPIRLGLQIPDFNFPGVGPDGLFEQLVEIATTAEESGFDSLFVMDTCTRSRASGRATTGRSRGTPCALRLAARTSPRRGARRRDAQPRRSRARLSFDLSRMCGSFVPHLRPG
jgi:hypothetical protein